LSSLSFYSSKNKRTLLRVFFLFLVFEVCIGGSGRVLEIGGGLTIRKINFTAALLMSFVIIFYLKKIRKEYAYIIIVFFITLIVSTILGIISYGNDERIVENILIQSFLLLLPFYSLFINDEKDIDAVVGIVKFSSIFMSVLYLIVLALIINGTVEFSTLYDMTEESSDFFARGESGFWYKGFLYLCVGLFFFDIENDLFTKRLKQLLIVVAVYFTFSRGFVVALFLTLIIHQFFFRNPVKSILLLVLAFSVISTFGKYYEDTSFDRYESDLIRKVQLIEVGSAITPLSAVVGHGFGKGVSIRENHMEINYLEIFHKQGIFGLFFWFSFLIYVTVLYINCKNCGYEKKARPFFQATLFIYLQSATNPYLTNSIGLNMIILSVVCLNVYLDKGRREFKSHEPKGIEVTQL